MSDKVATQQGGLLAKKGEVRLCDLLKLQDLTEGKKFEYRVLPIVAVKETFSVEEQVLVC